MMMTTFLLLRSKLMNSKLYKAVLIFGQLKIKIKSFFNFTKVGKIFRWWKMVANGESMDRRSPKIVHGLELILGVPQLLDAQSRRR